MSDRITEKDLQNVIHRLNTVRNSPVTPWTRIDGHNVSNIGHYHLDCAYGGYSVHRMQTTGGGVADVFRCGHVTKRDLYFRVQAFIDGIEAGKHD